MIDFKLPSLGADMDQGTLLEWRVVPGQAVKKGDVVAVVDTSKAAIDVEVWVDGIVQQLLTEVGQTVPVGTVMARLLAPGEVARGPTVRAARRRSRPCWRRGRRAAADAASPLAAGAAPSRPRVSPAARRRAAELGVDAGRRWQAPAPTAP